ncbi:sensor histidine kinase [Oerskovia enterophila]|uniref:sensor histidine kinase n=1 Tax=Oerskovia enterophila TaxID=43678 RepID=UPI0037F7DFA1
MEPDRARPTGTRRARLARPAARWGGQPVTARDAVGALVLLLVLAVPQVVAPERYASTVASVVALVVACVGLVWRRAHPSVAFGVALAAMVGSAAIDADSSLAFAPGLVATYSVAAYAGRREAACATLAMIVAYPAVLVLVGGKEPFGSYVVLVVVLIVLAAALGAAVGAQRAVVAAARDRAVRAEESREAEAARRVTQERLRIARELHDVVAHHAAVISVQAGAAEALFDKRPDLAREAIGHARDAGERVLSEMSSLLHLLRDADEPGASAPAPGLADLPRLLDEARSTGLEVVERTVGVPRSLSPVLDLTVFRVVQEALTNAHRYGTGRAELSVVHGADSVVVEVVNPLPSRTAVGSDGAAGQKRAAGASGPVAAHGSGLGLVGLRERVAAVGGTVETGSREGSWIVRVSLPVPAATADRPARAGATDAVRPAPQEAP